MILSSIHNEELVDWLWGNVRFLYCWPWTIFQHLIRPCYQPAMPKKETDDPIVFAESVLDQIISKHDPEAVASNAQTKNAPLGTNFATPSKSKPNSSVGLSEAVSPCPSGQLACFTQAAS